MTTPIAIGFFLFGIICLVVGGEGIVRSTNSLAKIFKLGAFTVSLTILAAATSAPELFLNILSAFRGEGGIGIGNILGANIVVIALLFGVATMIMPSKKRDDEAAWAFPGAIGVSLFLILLGLDGKLDRIEGLLLLILFGVWTAVAIKGEHKKRLLEKLQTILPQHQEKKHIAATVIIFSTSIILLFGGAELLIRAVKHFGLLLEVSPLLLAALMIALGTSLPELATTVVTLFKKRSDVRTGTLFGSVVFNATLILGLNALIRPIIFSRESFLMLALFGVFSLLLAAPLIFFHKHAYPRLWSLLLIVMYIFFVIYIISSL